MALITKPNSLTNGQVAQGSDVDSDFNVIYADYNGNITNANIASNAAIADTKLDQITTASKVSGTSLTGLASITSGAGVIPTNNLPAFIAYADTRFKIGSFTRDLAAASTDVAYTSVGFKPTAIMFFGGVTTDKIFSLMGVAQVGAQGEIFDNAFNTADTYQISTSYAIFLGTAAGSDQYATVKSFDTDGFTLDWVKDGTPTGTATIVYFAYR